MIKDVAVFAVAINILQLVVGFLVQFLLVLVRVMTKMECCPIFVLAVNRSSGPGIMDRKQEYQDDKEELLHDADIAIVGSGPMPAQSRKGARIGWASVCLYRASVDVTH